MGDDNKLRLLLKYQLPTHVVGWAIFFIVPLAFSTQHSLISFFVNPSSLMFMLVKNALWILLFYANLLYFTPGLLKTKSVVAFLLATVTAVIVVTIVNSNIHHLFPPLDFQKDPNRIPHLDPFGPQEPPQPLSPSPGSYNMGPSPAPGEMRPPPRPFGLSGGPFLPNLLISLMIVSVSTSVVFWSNWVRIKAEEQERAFQKIASELAILKLQISPHFLFNTLNNIRWLIRSASPNAEAAVIKLSSLLRYVLYQTNLEQVSLDKEIEHLRDYVELQKMRLVNVDAISLFVGETNPTRSIVPLLLIPLVENVFKYGEFGNTFKNKIAINVKHDVLLFETENLIVENNGQKKDLDYGIGLENVRRRLMLHYPDKHVLTISTDNGVFKLFLEIILT